MNREKTGGEMRKSAKNGEQGREDERTGKGNEKERDRDRDRDRDRKGNGVDEGLGSKTSD